MAYTLRIKFTGLFCFVPHKERNKLYVLLPTTQDTAHHHVPELRHKKLTNAPNFFGREHLSFAGISDGSTINVPDEACDLYEVTQRKIPRMQVEDVPSDRVRLRIELPPADRFEIGKRAQWEIVRKRPLTHEITWIRTGLALPQIKIMRQTLEGVAKPSLNFIPQGSTVDLFFRHLPNHSSCIKNGEEAPHFSLYYSLYSNGVTGPNPILRDEPEFPCVRPFKRIRPGSQRRFVDSTFTCMTAQVEPD
jgi:hypothetical protein